MTVAVTLVLVHGAWHGPWCWQLLREQLRGVEVRAVALSSSGSDPSKLGDLYEDAEIVRSVVTDVKGPVVVCAHSYGGAAVTEALVDMRNVRRLVYLCGPCDSSSLRPLRVKAVAVAVALGCCSFSY